MINPYTEMQKGFPEMKCSHINILPYFKKIQKSVNMSNKKIPFVLKYVMNMDLSETSNFYHKTPLYNSDLNLRYMHKR